MKNRSSAVRKAEILTTAASCCGVTGETVLTDSAIILLYASSLGAGNTGSLFSTSVLPLFNGLAVIPMAGIAPKLGVRKLALSACAISAMGYLLAAFAPQIGGASVILWSISCAALVQSGFIAGWFPLLNSFLESGRRVSFLGKMRFFHQLCATIFVLLAGWFLGNAPGTGKLQLVVLTAAIIFCGRFFCILAVPQFEMERKSSGSWLTNLKSAAANPPLRKFSLYQCIFNIGSFAIIPFSLLFLKHLGVPDNVTVFISGASFIGMMAGYWFIKHLTAKISARKTTVLLCMLCLPAAITFMLITQTPGTMMSIWLGITLIAVSFAVAAFSVISSAVMMSCAQPDNAHMTMAYCNAFYYSSAGFSRLLVSWIAGTNWFANVKIPHCGNGFNLIFAGFVLILCAAAIIAPFYLMRRTAAE